MSTSIPTRGSLRTDSDSTSIVLQPDGTARTGVDRLLPMRELTCPNCGHPAKAAGHVRCPTENCGKPWSRVKLGFVPPPSVAANADIEFWLRVQTPEVALTSIRVLLGNDRGHFVVRPPGSLSKDISGPDVHGEVGQRFNIPLTIKSDKRGTTVFELFVQYRTPGGEALWFSACLEVEESDGPSGPVIYNIQGNRYLNSGDNARVGELPDNGARPRVRIRKGPPDPEEFEDLELYLLADVPRCARDASLGTSEGPPRPEEKRPPAEQEQPPAQEVPSATVRADKRGGGCGNSHESVLVRM